MRYVLKKINKFVFTKYRTAHKIPSEMPIDVTNVTHAVSKDIEYFQHNLSRSNTNQKVNYTWEKSSEESPSFYKQHEIIFDREDLSVKKHKNTLDLMATTKGYPHAFKHNKWENDANNAPQLHETKRTRHAINLSSMTQ